MVTGQGQSVAVGGVASIPSRASMLQRMVASVMPQLDRLAVYLNEYDEVPAFLDDVRVSVYRSQDHGDRGDAGKFFAAATLSEGVYFALDDDIVYPPNYCAHMLTRLRTLEGRAVLGVHGVVYARRPTSFFDRRVIQFPEANDRLRLVSLVGTGTACFDVQTVPVTPDVFETGSMADLWFGGHVKARGVPMVCVDRPADWLTALPPTRPGSLWRAATNDSGPHERLVRSAGPWGRADLVERAERAGLAATVLPEWMRIPDLADSAPAGRASDLPPEDWPGTMPDWTDPHVDLYFDDVEHLGLARGISRAGEPVDRLGPVLLEAADASLPEAADCAEWALFRLGPADARQRPVLATLAMQLHRRGGQADRALDVYRRCALTTPNLERERALALLELGRPAEAARAIGFSPWTAELPALLDVAGALTAGNDRDVVSAAITVASRPELWMLRRPLPRWLRREHGPSARSAIALDLGELEEAGDQSGFDHSCFLRVLQAVGLDELGRWWLHRFGHRLGGGPHDPAGAMLRAQLQPSSREALAELDRIWRQAGLAGLEHDGGEGRGTDEQWPATPFQPGEPVSGSDLVSVIVTVDPADDPVAVRSAVESAAAQRYRPLEIVLVDQAGTADVGFVEAYDRGVKVVRAGAATGRAARRNAGVAAAGGRYVAVHEVGTRAHPQRIGEQLRLMGATGARAAVASVLRVGPDGVPAADPDQPPLGDVGGSLVLERALLDDLGPFDEGADVGDGGEAEMVARVERLVGYAVVARLQVPLIIGLPVPVDHAAVERARGQARMAHYFGASPADVVAVTA